MNEGTIHKIVNCEFIFKCPQSWEKMDNTDIDGVRYCGECQRDVHFAETDADLRRLSIEGKCVALFTKVEIFGMNEITAGIIAPRENPPPAPDFPKCSECQTFLSDKSVYCPRCGAAKDGSRKALRTDFRISNVSDETSAPTSEDVRRESWLKRFLNLFRVQN